MIDITPSRAENACVATSCFGLSNQEIQFALKFPGINHTQKLVWIALAILSVNDPEFTRQLSLHQFAKMLNIRAIKLWRIIQELEAMGFVHSIRHQSVPALQREETPVLINLLRRRAKPKKPSFWITWLKHKFNH